MEDEIIITDSLTKYYGQIKGIEDVLVKVSYYIIVIIESPAFKQII